MFWFKQARESFKKDDSQEVLPKEISQTFGEILSHKSKGAIEVLNTFAARYNETIFSGPNIPILKKEALLIGIVAACAVSSQIPGMENPTNGVKNAMDATTLLLAQQGEISKQVMHQAREGLLPLLRALSVFPGVIFTAGLAVHAKATFQALSQKDAIFKPIGKTPTSQIEEGPEPFF